MNFLIAVIKVSISVIVSFLTIISPGNKAYSPYKPIDSEKCMLNFAAISDLHIQTHEYNEQLADYTDLFYPIALSDFEKSEEKLDALVLAGDITSNGYLSQWQTTESILNSYELADDIILAAGNHDTWTRNEDGITAKDLFIEYNSKIANREISEFYYSVEIKGYTFIVLGSEGDGVDAWFSDAQLDWLKSELEKAKEKDLPIFVVSHWPLNQTHGLPARWEKGATDPMDGGIGHQSDIVEKILKEYDNVFLISGHVHSPLSNEETKSELGYASIESYGSFHSINLPQVNGLSPVGYHWMGTGYNVEVYENEVVFRARNYFLGTWVPEYDYVIELV